MNVVLLIWGQISFILGVGGNVFVLYATIFHKAIKLDKISTWIIKNLAIVDLCSCFFVIVPAIANQYSEGKWMFGSGLCYANSIFRFSYATANMVLINALARNKLRRCIYPLKNLGSSRIQKIFVTVFASLMSLMPAIWIVHGLATGHIE